MAREIKLIPNYIYFYHLDKFCVLPMYPETISDNMPSKFAETNALSRSAPVFSYINSGPRQVSIDLKMHRDLMNDLNVNVSNLKDNVVDFSKDDYIDTLIKYLQAASVPKYQVYAAGARGVIPPMVAVRFGDHVFIKGVVTSGINVTYSKPILVDNKYAQVEVSFTINEVDPYDADTIAQQGSFRGVFDSQFKGGIYKSNNTSIPNGATSGGGNNGNNNNNDQTQNGDLTQGKLPVNIPWVDKVV